MKLLKHLLSFVATFIACAAAMLAVLMLLDEKKRSSYINIYDEEAL